MIKFITIWEWYDEKSDTWIHNHIQNKWSFWLKPKPKSDVQKNSWVNKMWRKEFGFLVSKGDEIPKVEKLSP